MAGPLGGFYFAVGRSRDTLTPYLAAFPATSPVTFRPPFFSLPGGNGTTLMSDSASFVNNGTVTAPTGSSSAFLGASADSGATWIAGGSPATGVTVEAGASFGLGGATTLSPSNGFLDTCADGAMLFFTGTATVTGFDVARWGDCRSL